MFYDENGSNQNSHAAHWIAHVKSYKTVYSLKFKTYGHQDKSWSQSAMGSLFGHFQPETCLFHREE